MINQLRINSEISLKFATVVEKLNADDLDNHY